MRIKTILLTLMLLVAPALALADEALDLRKKIMFDQKRLVVMENMEFTEEEAAAFWPVYDKHQEELFQVNQRGAKLILAYASAFQTLTDEQAVKLVDEYYDIQDDRLTVMKKMAADVGKVLPGKKAFRYLQVESKLSAIGRYELAKEIPLAR
jgi:DNA-directed RNA polymerase subunit F